MKKDGGKATVENGALLSIENHAWFHKQSSQDQAIMNAMFQEYKKQYQECEVVFVDKLDLGFEIKAMEFHIDEREQKKEKYDRAKEKREFQKLNKQNQKIQLCKLYLKQGYMTQPQYDQLSEFFKLYSNLGGNGQAKEYYEKTMKLQIKEGDSLQ